MNDTKNKKKSKNNTKKSISKGGNSNIETVKKKKNTERKKVTNNKKNEDVIVLEKENNIEKKNKVTYLFLILCVISVTTILISNICSVKLFSIGKYVLPTSALLFPISYILGDVFTEVYGYKEARFVIILGFLCNAFMVLFFTISIALPAAKTWGLQEAYKNVLGTTPRMFIASLTAFLVGSLSNAKVMVLLKKITKGKHLWVRTIGSTIVGEFLDSLIFDFIAFYSILAFNDLMTTIFIQFLWKVLYEAIATPFTYFVITKLKKYEEINGGTVC